MTDDGAVRVRAIVRQLLLERDLLGLVRNVLLAGSSELSMVEDYGNEFMSTEPLCEPRLSLLFGSEIGLLTSRTACVFNQQEWRRVFNLLTLDVDALQEPLQRNFQKVLCQLRASARDGASIALSFWLRLGDAAEITGQHMSVDISSDGCGWFKCGTYQTGVVIGGFRCAGCRRKTYCDLLCQSRLVTLEVLGFTMLTDSIDCRDWKEGGHSSQFGLV